MKNHISFCVNNSKRLTFCFVNELQDVLRFLQAYTITLYTVIYKVKHSFCIFFKFPIFAIQSATRSRTSNCSA